LKSILRYSMIHSKMNKSPPIVVVGPAGCGKGRYIENIAVTEGRTLLHCFCRKDRTLRESRAKLHEWAFLREPVLVWLEGTDDLTPEAQSFLRRILETYSPSVKFCLECREIERLQEPIRSRCEVVKLSYIPIEVPADYIDKYKHYTWRQREYYTYIQNNPILSRQYNAGCNHVIDCSMNGNLLASMESGANPLKPIYEILNSSRDNAGLRVFITHSILVKSNPWCLIAYILSLNEPKDSKRDG